MEKNPYEFDAPGLDYDRLVVAIDDKGKKSYLFARSDYIGHYNLLKLNENDGNCKYYLPRMFIHRGDDHNIIFADKDKDHIKKEFPEYEKLLAQELPRIKCEHERFIQQNKNSSFDGRYTKDEQVNSVLPPPPTSAKDYPKAFEAWVNAQKLPKKTKGSLLRYNSGPNTWGD